MIIRKVFYNEVSWTVNRLNNDMRKKTLLLYSTTDGQTLLICQRIKSILSKSIEVDIEPINNSQNLKLKYYDQVIIGASIRYGKHKPDLYDFIEINKEELKNKKTGFFSVNVVARKPDKNTPETNPYMKKFLEISSWKPEEIAVFAGKLNYPIYRFFDKQIIRLIMFITKGPTDTNGIFEFTNWIEVEKFANKFKDK